MASLNHSAVGAWLTALLILGQASQGLAFDTLDGDSTQWPSTPTYSIGRMSPNIANADQLRTIRAALSSWRNVPGVDLNFREVANGGDITIDFLDRWPAEFGRYAAGVTQTSRRFSRISGATISLNEQNFEWSIAPIAGQADVQGVTTHEVGHALGLGHSFYRDSTMYWSDTGADLRQLSPDDIRGARFLYGDAEGENEGQLCDHCGSHDDCLPGSFCLSLEEDRSFCGQPCAGGCPDHAACFNLQNGGQTCAPLAGGCSDEVTGQFEEGDYCFGSDQCGANMTCIVLPGTARCTSNCRPNTNDCAGGRCVGGEEPGSTGICMRPGPGAYSEVCDSDFDCAALACVASNDGTSICAGVCDPGVDRCPNGDCLATGNDAQPGICLPPGNVREGQPCGTILDRCVAGSSCLNEGNQVVCRRICEPFTQCPGAFGCSPATDESWLCLPQDGPGLGADCNGGGRCGGGRLCAPVGARRSDVCADLCQPNNPAQCGPATCIDFGAEFGVCPLGAREMGAACDSDGDCLGGACVWTAQGDQCSQPCAADGDCPAGWNCREFGNERRACFRVDSPGMGGQGGSSGSGGQGGQGYSGGAAGSGGSAGSPQPQPGGTGGQGMLPNEVDAGLGGSQIGGSGGNGLPTDPSPGGGSGQPPSPDGGPTANGYYVVTKKPGGCACEAQDSTSDAPWFIFSIFLGLLHWRRR